MEHTQICCFTGHRSIDRETAERLYVVLWQVVGRLIEEGVRVFRAGGALGFDTMAALCVLEYKRTSHPELVLELCLPCRTQEKAWRPFERELYGNILKAADTVRYASDDYTRGCMQARNRMLADGSQYCVGYCVKSTGGSAYTLRYAERCGLRVINLAGMLSQVKNETDG